MGTFEIQVETKIIQYVCICKLIILHIASELPKVCVVPFPAAKEELLIPVQAKR